MSVVIIGSGHAGVQAACSLRSEGFSGDIILADREDELPYQRPPLSKSFITAKVTREDIHLRAQAFYEGKGIRLLRGVDALAIDRQSRRIIFHSGAALAYDHLILATGCRPRQISVVRSDIAGVFTLRNLADAMSLRAYLPSAKDVVILGGGFIGLEFAAAARHFGCNTVVIEQGPRVLGRVASPAVAEFLAGYHRSNGSDIVCNAGLAAIDAPSGMIERVTLADGRIIACDLLLVGVGVIPEVGLAEGAGLVCDNGIVVNDELVSSDPYISAIGDCARHPNSFAGGVVRLESVQNAVDQGRSVARRLTGKPAKYDCVPWFWSDQGDVKLQIAGLGPCDRQILRGRTEQGSFSVFGFTGGRLVRVESINRAPDHVQARRLLGRRHVLTESEAADESFDLKSVH